MSVSRVPLSSVRWVALAVVLGFSSPVDAFVCSRAGAVSGPSVAWTARTVPWVAHPSAFRAYEGADDDVLASFAAWSGAECTDLELAFGGERAVSAGFLEGEVNTNVVVLRTRAWPFQAGTVAITVSTFNRQSGALVDADIELNGDDFTFVRGDLRCDPQTRTMDLRNTLTHEVGHFIGLEHPPSTPAYREATMFASASSCETSKRTLAQDDVDGVCFIYPVGEPTQDCFEADAPSFAAVASDGGSGCRSVSGGLQGTLWTMVLCILWACRRGLRMRDDDGPREARWSEVALEACSGYRERGFVDCDRLDRFSRIDVQPVVADLTIDRDRGMERRMLEIANLDPALPHQIDGEAAGNEKVQHRSEPGELKAQYRYVLQRCAVAKRIETAERDPVASAPGKSRRPGDAQGRGRKGGGPAKFNCGGHPS